ncbi:hypothetical protein CR513_60562, partial [Mucuna pruriens]
MTLSPITLNVLIIKSGTSLTLVATRRVNPAPIHVANGTNNNKENERNPLSNFIQKETLFQILFRMETMVLKSLTKCLWKLANMWKLLTSFTFMGVGHFWMTFIFSLPTLSLREPTTYLKKITSLVQNLHFSKFMYSDSFFESCNTFIPNMHNMIIYTCKINKNVIKLNDHVVSGETPQNVVHESHERTMGIGQEAKRHD